MIPIAHYSFTLFNRLRTIIYTQLAFISAFWWDVHIDKGLKVIGKLQFRQLPNSNITIGKNCTLRSAFNSNLIGVNRPCMISTLRKCAILQIGDNCGFSGTVIGAFESIIIGNNVRCGANTLITDADWHLDDYRAGEPRPVIIEDGVWLGEGVKVMKGVTIGENSLIGAGSIVIKDIPSNVVAAGNPCKVIKPIQ